MTRVCVIGAGPCGMSFLYHYEGLALEGKPVPDIVCYDKLEDVGGMWNYTWRTGLDQYGEPCHGSMYHNLWSNGPKEGLEYPDYTFQEHFGKNIPSFPPRDVLFDYLKGRWLKRDLTKYIHLQHMVKNVTYNKDTDNFSVVVKDLVNDVVLETEIFSHVVIAVGHYSTPSVPFFPGIEKFPGRVMHAHDFRDATEFKGKRLLIVGASYSAEDLALQCRKYGAGDIITCWRTKPMNFHWPKGVEERPLLTKIEGSTVHFKDGSKANVDAIFLCTGYLHHYPFLADDIRLKSRNSLYPPTLYKGTVFTESGNDKVIYLGSQDLYYTFTMFDIQALWAMEVIEGRIRLPCADDMRADWNKWLERESKLKDCFDHIDFQTDFVLDLARMVKDYPYDLNVKEVFDEWEHDKYREIATFRDKSFVSKFTGIKAPVHHTPFMEAFDDSLETYMNQYK